MPSDSHDSLKNTLIANYRDLLAKLTRQFGSRDFAEDALQDTWLQLERAGHLDYIRNERWFVQMIAYNRVRDRLRKEKRNVQTDGDPDEVDDSPDPERAVQARADLSLVLKAMEQMPRRRQDIFLMAWHDDRSAVEIAKHFGISIRLVHSEIAKAREHCALSFKNANKPEKNVRNRGNSNVLDMTSLVKREEKK